MVEKKNKVSKDSKAMMDFDANKKSLDTAYMLLFFCGTFGAHRFYFEKIASAFVMLGVFLVSFIVFMYGIIQLLNIDTTSSTDFFSSYFSNNSNNAYIEALMAYNIIIYGSIGMLAIFLWAIADVFYIKGMVREHNKKLMDKMEEENE